MPAAVFQHIDQAQNTDIGFFPGMEHGTGGLCLVCSMKHNIKSGSGKQTVQRFRVPDIALTELGCLIDIFFPATAKIIQYRYIMTGFY